MKPFAQLPFAALPEAPRRPHSFFAAPSAELTVATRAFGAMRFAYRSAGSGEPLLLVHGLMTSSYSFRYLLEPLAAHYRVIVPDLPGAGRSDHPVGDYSARGLGSAVGDFMRALGLEGAYVVGNSLGGMLAMRLALDEPALIGRLCVIHSPAVPLARLRALRAALALPGSARLLDWLVRRDPERWAHKNVHYYDESLKSREEAREYGAPLATAAGRRAFHAYLRDTLDPRGLARFVADLRATTFPCPLRLLYARVDPMVPPAVGPALAALVPAAELVWLDDCSHFAHVDRPELVMREILAFDGRDAPLTTES